MFNLMEQNDYGNFPIEHYLKKIKIIITIIIIIITIITIITITIITITITITIIIITITTIITITIITITIITMYMKPLFYLNENSMNLLNEQPNPWDDGVKISKDDYDFLQECKKNFADQKRKIIDEQIEKSQNNVSEGFANITDDFNDVLLFGLLGIFFLIFTDYIYKLGRKSY